MMGLFKRRNEIINTTQKTKMEKLKSPMVIAVIVAAYVLGAAYGAKTPVVATVASKLPKSSLGLG